MYNIGQTYNIIDIGLRTDAPPNKSLTYRKSLKTLAVLHNIYIRDQVFEMF